MYPGWGREVLPYVGFIGILYHAIENAVVNTINVENDVKVGSVPGVG